MKEYKGQLKGFPSEIVEKMLEYQVAQGNPKNIGIFEQNNYASQECGGFLWEKTPEGGHFWCRVIGNKDFDLFFERYPKQSWKEVFEGYPKIMDVSSGSEKCKRVVVAKTNIGYWACTSNVKTLEDIVNTEDIIFWKNAEDITETSKVTEVTMEEISKAMNIPIEQLRIKKWKYSKKLYE